jgi:apoptosis-inducing factor 3
MLGAAEPFDSAPFFWSNHYDVAIAYVGHAERWDTVELTGTLEGRDGAARYVAGGKVIAFASVGRDRECLQAEVAMEHFGDPILASATSVATR